jgi:hypothetical protein
VRPSWQGAAISTSRLKSFAQDASPFPFFGLALFLMPPLLTLCHLEQFVCRAGWRIDVASLITLWPLFRWMVFVAVIMLCGLAILTIGGVLLLQVYLERISLSENQASDMTAMTEVRLCAGFRTTAHHGDASSAGAVVRKPSEKETAMRECVPYRRL